MPSAIVNLLGTALLVIGIGDFYPVSYVRFGKLLGMAMQKKPNILLITSDQQRGDCFGFEGRAVKTPHLDRMARKGT